MPTLHLSCAVSLDGYLDDTSDERAILSSPEDLEAVLALRAKMDMIVIGAETLRRDDPSLATRGDTHLAARRAAGLADHPVKVVVTRSGDIPADRKFFRDGDAEKIVLSVEPTDAPGAVVRFKGDPIDAVMALAEEHGLENVLIEGGAQLLTLAQSRADSFRLAVSPRVLGKTGHARFVPSAAAFLEDQVVTRTGKLGDTQVHWIDPQLGLMRRYMEVALYLSGLCPESETAFAVGCVGLSEDLNDLETGHSRETGPSDHAEEALLSKMPNPHTVVVTLEPCLHRASKPKGCAERLVAAGVRRVVYAVAEDETFTRQSGLAYLRENGVEVIHLPGFEAEFRAANPLIYNK